MSAIDDATPAEPPKRVTAAQIAREAGVSVPTVSRVLNGHADVSPETRARVERLLDVRGYRRRTRQRQTVHLVDLVFPDLDSTWAVEIIRGVEETTHAEGVGTVVSAIHGRVDSARQWLQNVRERDCDAVIFVTSHLEPQLQVELRKLDVPTVVVDPTGGPERSGPSIGATNWSGGLSATQHLLDLGHRTVWHVAGPPDWFEAAGRQAGWRQVLEEAGADVPPALPGDWTARSGYEAGRLLARIPEVTAVFTANDPAALGLLCALAEAGRRVPEDLSIVGFDDVPESAYFTPPLTTVRQDFAEVGRRGVSQLLELINAQERTSRREMIQPTLTIRSSTAPPAAAR